ncbi:MAG: methionine--tRNA ligase [Parachlamydiales bacterium]
MPAKRVLITSALLYANGKLHFGHIAGAYLSADIYARFERMQGTEVLFLSGSDEYGVAITLSAEKAGRSPSAHVEHFHRLNQRLFEQIGISFDCYSRTTLPHHRVPVYQYFEELSANGYVEKMRTQQLYSEAEGRFLADRYVTGICPLCRHEGARGDECPACGGSYEATDLINPTSKVGGSPLVLRETDHWFLRLDKLATPLRDFLAKKSWKPGVLNFASHYLDDLRPRAITRDGEWGVPVPDGDGKVFYVWFEACIGYLSAAQDWAERQGEPEAWKRFWCQSDTKLVQFIGKDNIFFHALFFPAMTMGQDKPYKLVDDLPANDFLTLEGRQFSKSEGWYVDLEEFLTRYSADQLRYTLAANAPETSDSEFTWSDFQLRCNSELLGKFGNFANRTLVFAQKHCKAEVPRLIGDEFLQKVAEKVREIEQAYATYSPRRACALLMEIATLGNVYFDNCKPWQMEPASRDNVIAACLNCLKTLAIVSAPIIPETAAKLWAMLGFRGAIKWEALSTQLQAGTPLPPPQLLFKKIEDEQIAEEMAKLRAGK